MKFIVIHTEARKELDAAIFYYEGQKVGLGLDLLSEVEKTIEKIQQNPNEGSPYKITGIRRYTIQHFPYLIFYKELEEVILVIAIAHGKRKPDYWKKRKMEM
ncbi:type II toxin-antitoxin system mRNA interferase toxin, RelE/StbE family [Scytonema sp. UIC 10036]|uniref:type II toxin-antitoxin system RelE/ParE family toxin n=1 Tax=Scytonema sp. UIC 10036 TaxID=2304196 RepID=UPI0012DA9C5D|nr:type II toxin-antitoxin system RelE/ParE family toxin [Scytonema sp. UIC 10036]MUG95951.1 type II toxin-antitoxin system mRNA interferase toxin, RelE/StbE family [Scytonema sp. UIC 10036]